MQLKQDWKTVLRKAWSMKFMAMAAVSNAAILMLALVPELLPRTWGVVLCLGVATGAFNLLAMWSRLVVQREIK
jgi:hypothetical protein